jgi:hypothetical protein
VAVILPVTGPTFFWGLLVVLVGQFLVAPNHPIQSHFCLQSGDSLCNQEIVCEVEVLPGQP